MQYFFFALFVNILNLILHFVKLTRVYFGNSIVLLFVCFFTPAKKKNGTKFFAPFSSKKQKLNYLPYENPVSAVDIGSKFGIIFLISARVSGFTVKSP